MTPDLLGILRAIEDPRQREALAREAVSIGRLVRVEAIREMYRQLGTWEKVGEAVGLPRQDAWRISRG